MRDWFDMVIEYEKSGFMNCDILVDSHNFWHCLKSDMLSAKKEILIQTLSFEGDRVGQELERTLLSLNPSIQVKILIDSYTKYILSDKFLFRPKNFFNSDLRQEKKSTRQIINNLRSKGMAVKFTRPVGLLLLKIAARDHKKVIVIDDTIAYLGGINFSEHNFEWHDMMIRFQSKHVAEFLRLDFERTWHEDNQFHQLTLDQLELLSFDGRSNESSFERIFKLIRHAKQEIWIHSPYLSFPFMDELIAAKSHGIEVHIITPDNNNRKFLKKYILWQANKKNLNIWLYQTRMSHLKALLIDDRYLIVGSSNFDYLSYRCHPESMAIIKNPIFITEFKHKIINKDIENCKTAINTISDWQGYLLKYRLMTLGKFFTQLAKM
jgi:cardiolipin synthase